MLEKYQSVCTVLQIERRIWEKDVKLKKFVTKSCVFDSSKSSKLMCWIPRGGTESDSSRWAVTTWQPWNAKSVFPVVREWLGMIAQRVGKLDGKGQIVPWDWIRAERRAGFLRKAVLRATTDNDKSVA